MVHLARGSGNSGGTRFKRKTEMIRNKNITKTQHKSRVEGDSDNKMTKRWAEDRSNLPAGHGEQ